VRPPYRGVTVGRSRGVTLAARSSYIRGDVNAILNALIREGVIASFETSFDSKANATKPVHIVVTVDSATAPDAAKRAVMHALDRFSSRVRVTVKAG
jgi:hypothetical protein